MFVLCVSWLGPPMFINDKWIWGLTFVYTPVKLINYLSVCRAWYEGPSLVRKFAQYTVLTKSNRYAKKRTSHAGCNACDAHFRRVLQRICYSNVAHVKRASCVQHLRVMCAGCCSGSMWHTRGMRTSDEFVARAVSYIRIADVAHF
jgi:hypothetical protein